MDDIFVGIAKTYTNPAGATHLQIIHELGDIVLVNGPVSNPAYTTNSIGVHKFIWTNNSNVVIQTTFYNSVVQYVTESDFFNTYESLEDANGDNFAATERVVRLGIESYTGQKFGPLVNKTLELPGDGGDLLSMPLKVRTLSSIVDQWGSDFTSVVEIYGGSDLYLHYINNFRGYYQDVKRDITVQNGNFFDPNTVYSVAGNFGWEWVPSEVTEAAKLILADTFTGTNEFFLQGLHDVMLGDFRYRRLDDPFTSTGNVQADLLLSAYTVMRIGLI